MITCGRVTAGPEVTGGGSGVVDDHEVVDLLVLSDGDILY